MKNSFLIAIIATLATVPIKTFAFGQVAQAPAPPAKPTLDTAISDTSSSLDADDYLVRGLLHKGDGQTADAIADFTQAVRLAPDDYFAHLFLGNAFFDQDQLVDAIKELQAVVRLKPHFLTGHVRLARALQKNKQFAAARTEWLVLLDSDSPYLQKEATTALKEIDSKTNTDNALSAMKSK